VSDDIVTRLRGKLVVRVNGEPWVTFDALPVLGEAADEIERLRQEVSRLMQIICDSSPDDDYLLVRREADAIWERIHKDNQAMQW